MIRLKNIGVYITEGNTNQKPNHPSIVEFVDSCVRTQPGKVISVRTMYRAYVAFIGDRYEPSYIQNFGVTLQRLGLTRRAERCEGIATRVWENVIIDNEVMR